MYPRPFVLVLVPFTVIATFGVIACSSSVAWEPAPVPGVMMPPPLDPAAGPARRAIDHSVTIDIEEP